VNHSDQKRTLLIDAGNTRIKAGVCAQPSGDAAELPDFTTCVAVPCGASLPWKQLVNNADESSGVVAAIAGSNPKEVARIVREWPAGWRAPRVVDDRRTFPLTIDVDFPDKVGIDRLLGAIAANVVRGKNQPAVIISSGTATTVDYVNERGHFCGGAILPGFELCAKALNQYTALLPLIEMDAVLEDGGTPAEIGRNTHAAITSGLYWGHVGAVKELLHRLTQDVSTSPLVLLTGGAAPLLSPHLPGSVQSEPHLALQGLALVVAHQLSHIPPR
jgi:type III pantothenate kinase